MAFIFFSQVTLSSVKEFDRCEEVDGRTKDKLALFNKNVTLDQPAVKMEYKMLKFLEFEIGIPTIRIFVRKFVIAAQEEDEMYDLLLEFMADYLAELSLFEYKCLKFLPSMVAAAVVFLSRCTIVSDSPPWSTPKEEETGYDAPSLKECVLLIYDLQMNKKAGGFLEYKCVSAFKPPEEIPDYYFDEFEEDS